VIIHHESLLIAEAQHNDAILWLKA